jgi:hypothetical protein
MTTLRWIERRLTPESLGAVLAQTAPARSTSREPSPLLLTTYVTPQLAHQLREHEQPFRR